MQYFLKAALLHIILMITLCGFTQNSRMDYTRLRYTPQGDAFVIENGGYWNNRPLYCDDRKAIVFAGEQPALLNQSGRLMIAVTNGKDTLFLHQFSKRKMMYRPAHIEWLLSDSRLQGLELKLHATTLPGATGFVVRLQGAGTTDNYSVAWCWAPANLPEKKASKIQTSTNGFSVTPDTSLSFYDAKARFSVPVKTWQQINVSNIEPTPSFDENMLSAYTDSKEATSAAPWVSLKGAVNFSGQPSRSTAIVAWLPLQAGVFQTLALIGDDNDHILVPRQAKLDSALIVNANEAFEKGLAQANALAQKVVVNTPNPYFNAAVSASIAAVKGLFVTPCFVHGGSAWRIQQPGWRMMMGATNYGWHDRLVSAVKYWSDQQIKTDNLKTTPAVIEDGMQQDPERSMMYGKGFVDYHNAYHYEFQTQFFDEAVREWRATGDTSYEKILMPALELHLDRCKKCYDPDGDGLYESYINTWPTDSQWYNGGGTVEQSAYMYYGCLALSEMKKRSGDGAGALKYKKEAERIKLALDRILWLPKKGQYASYLEQGGLKRVHADAWIYSEHLPIEAGMSSLLQGCQAMYYTESQMERFLFPFGGEMRQTSNWVPGQWSVRELFHGDNFAMALGYFLTGQGNDGFSILEGTMKESMFGDRTPKNGYSNELGKYNNTNITSPGGLSHPNAGVDFNDITTMFTRAVTEGLFGYQPNYPQNNVAFQPAFPSSWNHASMKTPDFSINYEKEDNAEFYSLSITKKAKLQLRALVNAKRIRQVLVNKAPVKWSVQPACGNTLVLVNLPETNQATVEIFIENRRDDILPIEMETEKGDTFSVALSNEPSIMVEDPQHVIPTKMIIGNRLRAIVSGDTGSHLFFIKSGGAMPYYRMVKLHLKDTESLKKMSDKMPGTASTSGNWSFIDCRAQFNGDIKSIFKQKYISPRPNTVSARIGYDGWSAWTFHWWKIPVPEIKLDSINSLLDKEGVLVTPQYAQFMKPEGEKNIAFTSLWDNWPRKITIPVNQKGNEAWLLVCGSTNIMQLRIANAVIHFQYMDGTQEKLTLYPPDNFWSLTKFGNTDYNYERDGFSLPSKRPAQVQLGQNCRAMVYGWKLKKGAILKSVSLETMSQEVVIGLMALSLKTN